MVSYNSLLHNLYVLNHTDVTQHMTSSRCIKGTGATCIKWPAQPEANIRKLFLTNAEIQSIQLIVYPSF